VLSLCTSHEIWHIKISPEGSKYRANNRTFRYINQIVSDEGRKLGIADDSSLKFPVKCNDEKIRYYVPREKIDYKDFVLVISSGENPPVSENADKQKQSEKSEKKPSNQKPIHFSVDKMELKGATGRGEMTIYKDKIRVTHYCTPYAKQRLTIEAKEITQVFGLKESTSIVCIGGTIRIFWSSGTNNYSRYLNHFNPRS